jgi:hypothetical protein
MGYTFCGARASRVKAVWPTWAFRLGTKQGSPPISHWRAARRLNPADRWRVAGGGGARELALEVRVPIWGIGSGGAHRGGLVAATQVGGGELVTVGQRRGGEHWLGVRGATMSSGGGHCSGRGARRWSEVALNRKATSTNEGDGRLDASTGPCGG